MVSENKHSISTNDLGSAEHEESNGHGLIKRSKSPLFHSRVTAFDRWLALAMMDVVGNPRGTLRLWDGKDVTPPVDDPVALILYGSRIAMWKTIINPELHWGDLYCNGQLELEGDLAGFLEIIYSNLRSNGKGGPVRRLIKWLGHRRIANSHARAKENIHHHYDIGNDFYRLWLDTEEMQYTCAYFPDPWMSLEDAQIAKLDHICRKLQLKPGDTVVEAGCGWGGLARFMARRYGVNVKAYNISKEQVSYARQRAVEEGLSDRVEYILDDYRNITGEYDVFVSVGMLEHVGRRDYSSLGQVIDRCLKPEGRGLIHTIGRISPGPMNAWIERRIFPGGYVPTLKQMMEIFEPGNFQILDVENLRLHYAETLRRWLARFENSQESVRRQFDARFVRMWRMYLAGSVAAFESGYLQLYQVVIANGASNQIPRTREQLYDTTNNRVARVIRRIADRNPSSLDNEWR